MSLDETAKKVKRVSIASNSGFDIQPVVYSFKGPPQDHVSGAVINATRPPTWLYHDHVMGVIWMIFHKEKNYVGISQLQWCLRFLLDLKNSQGEYTEDMEICIQAVQDDLIEQYAKLGPAMEKSIEEKSSGNQERSDDFVELVSTSVETREEDVEEQTKLNDDVQRPSVNDNEMDSMENNDGSAAEGEATNGDETFINGLGIGIAGTSTPKEEEPRTSIQEKENKNKYSDKTCGSKCISKKAGKKKMEILSFTYDEMVTRGPTPCTQPYLIEDDPIDQSIERDQVNRIGGILGDINSSGLVSLLNSSRQQHVERINNEMTTLRILERLLENMNNSGFPVTNAEYSTQYPGMEKFSD